MTHDSRDRRYYVYEWYVTQTNEVFYVGKGCGSRYKTRKRENEYFMKFLNTHECASRIVRGNLTEQEAFDLEIELIAHYRSIPGNRLTNVQDGGDNPPRLFGDKSPSKRRDVREKIKRANTQRYIDNPNLRDGVSRRMKAFCHTEEGKKIISERSKAIMSNQQTREKISKRVKEYFTDEVRAEVSERMKALYSTEDMRSFVTGANNGASRRVSQYLVDGTHVADFETLKQAQEMTGVSFKSISKVVRGHNKTAGGYVWRFSDEKEITYAKRAYRTPPQRKKKAILQYSLDGTLIREYESVTEATVQNGYKDHSNISICLSGRTKSAYGYIWKYKAHDDTVPSP